MKVNPNYKWYNPEKHNTVSSAKPATRPSNAFIVYHGEKPHTLDMGITPGKLAGQYPHSTFHTTGRWCRASLSVLYSTARIGPIAQECL